MLVSRIVAVYSRPPSLRDLEFAPHRRTVAINEGGYSNAYVPFCALAVIEELARHRTPGG